MSRNPVPLITLLCFSILAAGQKNDYRLLLRGHSITPGRGITIADADNFNHHAVRINNKSFTVIQFEHIPTIQERATLLQAGIELLDYVPNNAYTATVSGQLNVSILNAVKARSVIDLKPEEKMFSSLAAKRFPYWAVKLPGTIDVWISFPKTFSYQTVVAELKSRNFDVLSEEYRNYRILSLRVSQQKINELAALPFIEYVQPAPAADKPLNNNDVVNARANVITSSLGRNLDGKGVVIGIGDDGDPLQHIDFAGRTINRAALIGQVHGVHVTGTAAGAGIVNERYKGFAPKSTIVSQAYAGILASAPAYVNDYGMVITNNSYGNVEDDCETFGVYDLYSRILDQYAVDMPYLENVFAAGNSGTFNCSPYLNGFSNVLGGYQTAKNVITIGNTSELGVIRPGSSKGPVRDGRIKPEMSVQGYIIVSTYPVNSYGASAGTSMAAPGASGGLGLLYQRYRQLHGGNPKNGLMKALLCNGATDMGNPGPDFSYGFGWMNLLRSVKMLENSNYFNDSVANSQTKTHTISVPANTAQLKVMLYWNDPAAAVLAAHTLVNDLDLEVVDPSSTIKLPYLLDTLPGNANNIATTGVDHVNNIEQVVIDNPVAGTYTFNVKGTSIAQNPRQEYFLVYDTIPVSTTLTFPVGGERLTAGDLNYVSWDSYGNPSNGYTLEYSTDDGATWNLIPSGNVAAGVHELGWTIPSIFTDKARVRVTQNVTGQVSTSEKFTIVGIPTVSLASTQCEGYIAINWTTITEATGYEVMMLRGDEMVSVATVPAAQTNYTFSGLSKDSVYWVTVRALLNGNPGRRAVAVSRQPNNGTCAGTISDNDLKIDTIIAPCTGRELTSTSLTASTIVQVRVKNLDNATINNFNIKYSVNGAPFITETNISPVSANGVYTHNFAATYDFSSIGVYQLRVVVENTSAVDPVSANDTMTVIVKQLANPAITLNIGSDFLDDIETAADSSYYQKQIGLAGLDRYDFISDTAIGRLRTFVNSGIAYSGSKAITLDIDRYNNGGHTDSLTGTFNLGAYSAASDDIRLDFRFKHHGQVPNAANNVWVRGDDQKSWINVYDLYANQGDAGIFNKSSSLELGDILVANSQNFSTSFQVRWGQWGQILTADNLTGAGYTFDDIHLYKVTDDIQMVKIDSPLVSSCGLSNAVPVKVSVRNSANSTITSIPVKYKADNGAIVTETIPTIGGNATVLYTFTTPADLSAPGQHTVQVWVDYPSDSYRDNDTATVNLYNSPVISSFPYLENFEADSGSWYATGIKSSWQYGTPASQKINRAASGSKAWKTSLVGNYNDLEQSYLYSPCFDITGMTTPTLSFSVALDLEDCGSASLCDAAYIEYSADGITWSKLGLFGQGTNWYNKNYTGNNANVWSIQDYTHWHVATIPLPAGLSRLRLRFVMSSDPYTSHEGIAVDDIHIYDNIYGIYTGTTMGSPVTQSVSGGTSWIDFTSGGQLVASVMPNNQNMGSTDVQAYINSGAVRTNNLQYYHDRNITIKPATRSLADSATVRFYFLDTETENLINANSCGVCSKPTTAYDLGVSKYNDATLSVENGTITDDILGNWLYIVPSNVVKVPFDKGYYAEFKVKDFSEFWLNNGGQTQLQPLPVKLEKFNAIKKTDDVLVEWTTSEEINVSRYEIEVAKGYSDYQQSKFIKIGTVISRNSSSEQSYSYTDAEKNKSGTRYYRLKIIDKDGKVTYSEVKPVVFNADISWQVYPNPSDGLYSFVYQLNQGAKMTVKVYDVNARLVKEIATSADGFVQKQSIDLRSAKYTPGLYLVEASSGEKKQLFKLIKQ
ncbi:MAG: S8 family serine peptidase [Chitinophagaceae bacterium]